MSNLYCSPKHSGKNHTCYDNDSLKKSLKILILRKKRTLKYQKK